MILDLRQLKEKYSLDITGVIHIGAHYGEEDKVYGSLNINKRIYFEPVKSSYETLVKTTDSRYCEYHNVALGNTEGTVEINLSSNMNGSASVLKPKNHLNLHPHVRFNGVEEVLMRKLDTYKLPREYNMINIDVQGYELEVFKGAKDTLHSIDYIMAEINRDEVYENCAHVDELQEFLSPYGFRLVEVDWAGKQWGDGFFIKE